MAGRGQGATHETAGGAKKRNKDRQRFKKAFQQGVEESISNSASLTNSGNLTFATEDVPDFTPRKPREQPGERQYQAGDTGGTLSKKERPGGTYQPPKPANTIPQRTKKAVAGSDRRSAIKQAFNDIRSGETKRRSEERKERIRQAFNNNPARRKRLGIK